MARVARTRERAASPEELADDRRRHQQVKAETSPITGSQPEGSPPKTTPRVLCVVECEGASLTFSVDKARPVSRDLSPVRMAELGEGALS